jgi:hypothetical protein
MERGGDGVVIEGPATISGGIFQGGSSGLGFSSFGANFNNLESGATVQVVGGLFASPFVIGSLSGGSEVDFFGTLAFTAGQLTGTLADGTPINQGVLIEGPVTVLSSPGEVRFLAIPAPPSLVLLGTGLLSTLGTRWLRRRQARVAVGC